MAVASLEPVVPLPGSAPDPALIRSRSRPFSPLEIAVDRCKGCELCAAACPKGVLELDRAAVNRLGHHPIRLTDAQRCTSCAFCARVCPDAVFTVLARPKEA